MKILKRLIYTINVRQLTPKYLYQSGKIPKIGLYLKNKKNWSFVHA